MSAADICPPPGRAGALSATVWPTGSQTARSAWHQPKGRLLALNRQSANRRRQVNVGHATLSRHLRGASIGLVPARSGQRRLEPWRSAIRLQPDAGRRDDRRACRRADTSRPANARWSALSVSPSHAGDENRFPTATHGQDMFLASPLLAARRAHMSAKRKDVR